ncbi:MAG TPA: efflux RND transporter periplasmic adaptor subunit [Candidatus Polarisedimenticolia bacterium]
MRRWISILLPIGLVGALPSCARGDKAPVERAVPVRTARVENAPITEWIRLNGRIAPPPDGDATLAPLVAGVLLAVPVREGQNVRTDEILARVEGANLDDALHAAEAAQRRAEAEAAFRRSAATRTRALVDKGVASRQDAEADESAAVSADAALAEASSSLATARRKRGWSELRAPFNGVVVRVFRRAGESVDGTPATPVLQIASASGSQVAAEATGEMLSRLKPGQTAEIMVKGSSGAPLKAHLLRIARAVDPATGSGEVRLAFEEAAPRLPFGLAVEVRAAVDHKEGAILVPARALRKSDEGKTEAVVMEQGKAVIRAVVTGLSDGDRVEVVSGLSPDEAVVVDDPVGLAEGTALRERP